MPENQSAQLDTSELGTFLLGATGVSASSAPAGVPFVAECQPVIIQKLYSFVA